MFLCFYGNVLVTSFTVILRPLDYGIATRGNPGFSGARRQEPGSKQSCRSKLLPVYLPALWAAFTAERSPIHTLFNTIRLQDSVTQYLNCIPEVPGSNLGQSLAILTRLYWVFNLGRAHMVYYSTATTSSSYNAVPL
jgi:hypothetical protein